MSPEKLPLCEAPIMTPNPTDDEADRLPESSSSLTAFLKRNLVPYSLIGILTLFCHGFILTNDGTIWDSWYVLNFLTNRNWSTLHDFFGSVGIPLYAWLYWLFAYAPDIITAFMWATFFCLLVEGFLIFHLALRLCRLTRSEALVLALLSQAMPLFTAAQDFIMFFYIFTHTLFLVAAVLATVVVDTSGKSRWLVRCLAVIGFYVSFTNAALLVYYGAVYLLLFFRYRQLQQLGCFQAVCRFIARYPDLLLLPPVTWVGRFFLTPQYGWYESYNMPSANLKRLAPNLLSFFRNAMPYHFKHTVMLPLEHPLVTVLLVIGVTLSCWLAPKNWCAKRSNLSTFHIVWFGCLSLFLAIFPFAAAGKWFSPMPLGALSRHCILTALPLAILLLALLRLLFLGRVPTSRWLPPIVGCMVIVLGSQITLFYVVERAEWIFSRALLHNATRNKDVRDSSVIVLKGQFNVVTENAYALYGFASAFGDMKRLVTAQLPENRQFFTPSEIEKILKLTTLLPSDFRHIDPSGRQIVLMARRNRGDASDLEIVSRYLKQRFFGTQNELENFLVSLVTLNTAVLKPATPLALASTLPESGTPAAGVPQVDFNNGVGMHMVRLQSGWWVSRFETTQAQYARLMASNPSLFKDPVRPVECVSWHEAVEFCKRLTDSEAKAGRLPSGFIYRLPTTGEFDQFATGASLDNAIASARHIRWQTAPVGSLPPNRLGLHDVFGNVWEWCLDWSDGARRYKVSKGGSWANVARELVPYSGTRGNLISTIEQAYIDSQFGPIRKDYPDQGFWDRGFRCVLAHAVAEPATPITH